MTDSVNGEIEIQCLVVGRIRTNCYVIANKSNSKTIIVDPGAQEDIIINYIKRKNLKPEAILLTHGHFDHIMAAADLASEYNIKIYAGEKEEELIQDPYMNCSSSMGSSYGLKADIWLRDNEIIEPAGIKIKVIYTPGHTIGGVSYYLCNNSVLLSGDTLFLESVGRTDLPTGNGNMIIDSIKNKLFKLDDDVEVLAGHGDTTTIGHEKRNNMYI